MLLVDPVDVTFSPDEESDFWRNPVRVVPYEAAGGGERYPVEGIRDTFISKDPNSLDM